MLSHVAFFSLIAIASAVPSFAQAASADASARETLMRLEAAWNEAHLRGDTNALDRLWADDIVITVPLMPVMRKADAVVMSSGPMRFEKYATSDVRVQLYGDAAVVTGHLVRVRVRAGREVTDNWRFTKMCVRQGSEWRVVAWHASEAAP